LNRIRPVATDRNAVGLDTEVRLYPQQRQAGESRPLARAGLMKTTTQE